MDNLLTSSAVLNEVNNHVELAIAKSVFSEEQYTEIYNGWKAYCKLRRKLVFISLLIVFPAVLLTLYFVHIAEGNWAYVTEGTCTNGNVTYSVDGVERTSAVPDGNLEDKVIQEGKTQLYVYLDEEGNVDLVARMVDDPNKHGGNDSWLLPFILIPCTATALIVLIITISLIRLRKGKAKVYFDFLRGQY